MALLASDRRMIPETDAAAARLSSWSMPQHARRRQGTQSVLGSASLRIGSPACDTGMRLRRWFTQSRSGSDRLVDLSALIITTHMKQPSFADRCARMTAIGRDLIAMGSLARALGEEVGAEAERMTAAAKRFTERRAQK